MFLDHFLCKDNYYCTLDPFFCYKIHTITIHTQKESYCSIYCNEKEPRNGRNTLFVYIICTGYPKNFLKRFSEKAKRYF